MPCRDYPSDDWSSSSSQFTQLKERADMLARLACTAMNELERQGTQDFVLLKNEELRTWWEQHKIDDAAAAAAKVEKARLAKLKKDALAKLSPEERKVLGIKR